MFTRSYYFFHRLLIQDETWRILHSTEKQLKTAWKQNLCLESDNTQVAAWLQAQ